MSRPRKWSDDAERRAAQNDRRKVVRRAHRTQFVAVDGEGIGRGKDHRYVLLGVGSEQLSDPDGLQFGQIASFLYEQYLSNPLASFVGFFLTYDFTQWFKTLPENRARMLLSAEGIATRQRTKVPHLPPFPVRYEGWEFDILGMKRFKLRPEGAKSWMYICDAGSFFQASLMSVIDPAKWDEPIVSKEEYAILQEGKAKRDSATLDGDMRRYTSLENDTLARLMDRLNMGFVQAGIRLKKNQWFGPGQAAQYWLSLQKGMPTSADLHSMWTIPLRGRDDTMRVVSHTEKRRFHLSDNPVYSPSDLGRLTYYGGWFEIFAHGHVPGITWEYDINSAYPHIASGLPCLLHGEWSHGTGIPGKLAGDSIRVVHARVSGTNPRLGAMSHRLPDGTIRRPQRTAGYYWQDELDASVRAAGIDDVEYLEWWQYDPCSCPPPLRRLSDLYQYRIKVGKNTPAGKAAKLVYNSMYGKLAQSVGNPKYGNSIYASLITAGCRKMILDAISTHPRGASDLVMVATDGVYFRSSHPDLPLSNAMGNWDATPKENLTLFKPGVYWDDNARQRISSGDSPSFKARGINAAEFAKHVRSIDDHFSTWQQDRYPAERDPIGDRVGWYPRITFTSGFSMVSCQQAIQRGKWRLAGTLGHEPYEGICDGCSGAHLTQDADPISKRHSGQFSEGVFWSQPYQDPGNGQLESCPYDKRFGQMDDPEAYGITDDGPVLDSWKGLFSS